MKVTSILFTAILATASVQAMPTQDASPEDVQVFQVKRAAEAIAEALAAPAPFKNSQIWCYRPGEACYKAKRDALALASVFAQATESDAPSESDLVERDPEAAKNKNIWCYRPGEACYKAKRDAIAIAQKHEDAEELAKRDPEAAKNKNIWCYRPGEACYKVRRAAMALVDAVAAKNTVENKASGAEGAIESHLR